MAPQVKGFRFARSTDLFIATAILGWLAVILTGQIHFLFNPALNSSPQKTMENVSEAWFLIHGLRFHNFIGAVPVVVIVRVTVFCGFDTGDIDVRAADLMQIDRWR